MQSARLIVVGGRNTISNLKICIYTPDICLLEGSQDMKLRLTTAFALPE